MLLAPVLFCSSAAAGQACCDRVAQLEARMAASEQLWTARFEELTAEVRVLRAKGAAAETGAADVGTATMPRQAVGAADAAHESVPAMRGRQLSDATCCRWMQGSTCPASQSDYRLDKCTSLYEYLEHKTSTHEFEDVESCLGTDDSTWQWRYDSISAAAVTLSGGGAEVATVRTPLKVSHAAGCTTAPQLTVQLNTTLAGAVDVVGRLTVGGVDLLASLQTLQALLTNLGTSSLALGLVAFKGKDGKYLSQGWTAGDAPGMATVVADYEAFRLNGGTEGYVCITTSHDSNNFVRKLEMNDGGTVTISTSTSRGCADAMRWQIFTPATTSDG
eukprot:3751300-Prymnesium_polylepis.1